MSTRFEAFRAGLLQDPPSAALRLTPASAEDVVALSELRALGARARGAGAEHIDLDQMADNAAVERLYTRLGFQIVGHELTRDAPFDWHATGALPAPFRVRSPSAADVVPVADWLAKQNLLESLDGPELPREDIASRLWRVLERGGEAVRVGFIDERPCAVAWYEHRASRRGAPMVVLHALRADAPGEDGARRTGSSLRHLLGACAADWTAAAAQTAHATVWGPPSSPALIELWALGFDIARRKWRWRL